MTAIDFVHSYWKQGAARRTAKGVASSVTSLPKAKDEGREKVILFNLSGHGLIDMAAYDRYIAGDLANYQVSDDEIANNVKDLPQV